MRVFGFPPVRADTVGAVEVGEHEDVEELGAGSGTEGVNAIPEPPLQLVGSSVRHRPWGFKSPRPT